MTRQTPDGPLSAEENAALDAYVADHFPRGATEEGQHEANPDPEGDGWVGGYIAQHFGPR